MSIYLQFISETICDTIINDVYTKNVSDLCVLSGNAYSWAFGGDESTFKFAKIDCAALFADSLWSADLSNYYVAFFKYDGSLLAYGNASSTTDTAVMYGADHYIYLSMSDADSGWLEAWTTGTSFTGLTWGGLTKAYFNGWKLTTADVNVASCVWTGIASGTIKSGSSGYTHVTTTIDTGFTPYKMIYQLATPVVTNNPFNWTTPVSNRTSASYYNFADINRVDGNSDSIVEYLTTWLNRYAHCVPSDEIATPPTLETYTTQDISTLPKPSVINLVERNIEAIKTNLGEPTSWLDSVTNWTPQNAVTNFIYTDANRLESNLSLLKTSAETLQNKLDRIDQALLYCGTFNAGQDNEGIF